MLLNDPRSRQAVDIACQFADGDVTESELQRAEDSAKAAFDDALREKGKMGVRPEWAALVAANANAWFAASRANEFAHGAVGETSRHGPERTAQSHLLRCIFDRLPFQRPTVDEADTACREQSVVKLAQAIYEERAFQRLPSLGAALRKAGCNNIEILAHCGDAGPHARGCWVVDLLIGRS